MFFIIDCDTDGDIRLVGGREEGEGRLELCRGGEWGAICNQGWDLVDAEVACRQLFPAVNLEGKKEAILAGAGS